MERKEGYYFVNYKGRWQIAEYCIAGKNSKARTVNGEEMTGWVLFGESASVNGKYYVPSYDDKEFDEIDERPIIRQPDEIDTNTKRLLDTYDRVFGLKQAEYITTEATYTNNPGEIVKLKAGELIRRDNNGAIHKIKDLVTAYTPPESTEPVNLKVETGPAVLQAKYTYAGSTDELVDKILEEQDAFEEDEYNDACPDCNAPTEAMPNGGIKCTKCPYWFCY